MAVTTQVDHELAQDQDIRLLKIFNYYRVCLSLLLLLAFFSGSSTLDLLNLQYPKLFITAAAGYAALTIFSAFVFSQERAVDNQYISLNILIDLFALTLLTYAHEGVSGGLSNLMIFSVAAGSMLLKGRHATLFAAFASLLLLASEGLHITLSKSGSGQFFQVGVNGMVFFTIALLIRYVARRIESSESLAVRQASDIAQLEQLNDLIIQRMNTGILVSDRHGRIRMMNDAAQRQIAELLGPNQTGQLPEPLHFRLQSWLLNPQRRTQPFKPQPEQTELQANFAALTQEPDSDILIFIEDVLKTRQQAQQLKLASLGQLTASIAHEIRNPLGAISHAAQLLAESDDLSETDKRLTLIMQNHSQRLDNIIENVLHVSRRKESNPESLDLRGFLATFLETYLEGYARKAQFHMDKVLEGISIKFDPGQLDQVLTNLVANGLRYSERESGEGQMYFVSGISPVNQLPYLDIQDTGPGVSEEALARLFEPFHTSENEGTGLGLFISRELCEANQASLDYIKTEEPGACFRITFSNPNRILN